MIGKEIDEKKTKYFVIAIIILIILSVLLVVHFNNKSLVNPDEDIEPKVTTRTTTTTQKTTTKVKKDKVKVNNVVNTPSEVVTEEVVENEEVSKTTIDEENKLIYDYKLSDEITSTDVIKSEVLNIDKVLLEKNIIKLYDISLYDVDNIKKSVKNTSITISIPVTKELKEYENYKVVYVDENNEISEEEFESVVENGYIKFTTTHLSKFGIIGTKKIDLSKVTLDIKINDESVNVLNDLYVSTEDEIDIVVYDLDSDYIMSYLLKDENNTNEYQTFNKNMFKEIKTPSKYTLIIKIIVENQERVFEIGKFNVYDIVFNYDNREELEEDVVIGELKNEDGTEYNYVDKEINKDIVIINKEDNELEETNDVVLNEEKKEEIVTEGLESVLEELEEGNTTIKEEHITLEDNNDSLNSDIETNTDIENNEDNINVENNVEEEKGNEEFEEELEDKATIKVNGNIYLVEKTDISNLEMTGHLIIDTNEDITFRTFEDKLLTSNLYTITIKSKEFSLNGVKYTYDYINEKIVITKVEDSTEVENFEDIFDGFGINSEEKDNLVLETYTK